MTKLKISFFSCYLLFFCFKAFSQDFPERPDPPQLVNDFARVLETSERQSLENKLRNYNDSTSTQIAIVTLRSLGGYDVAQYSFELAERWGIGQEGKDNGILILVAVEDRRLWIATGYGLEEFVPDAMANRIVDRTLRPNFRDNDFYKGLDDATSILMSLLSGQFIAEAKSDGLPLSVLVILILIFILIIFLISRRGGGGGSLPPSRTFGNPYRRGSTWTDFSSGSGSFGGFGSGGGSSFGGFGGGSFGGGGAGGSW